MLNVNRVSIDGLYNYYLNDGKNELGIVFCGNGDLYFSSQTLSHKEIETEFLITKENMEIYNLFDKLFNNIKKAEVFHINEFDLEYYSSEELKERYDQVNEWNEELRNSYIYKKIFKDNTITWISDDSISFDIDSADALRIIKEADNYRLKFTYYENEFPYVRSIRIRNSGSRYKPFNAIMMDFFNKLQEYDPTYHQIHIDEYLYNQNKVKKLTINS